jgi:hypothetical protein
MKNVLDNPPMTLDQARLVEEHAAELFQARKLFEEYPYFLYSVLKEKLSKALGYEVEFNVFNWGICIPVIDLVFNDEAPAWPQAWPQDLQINV